MSAGNPTTPAASSTESTHPTSSRSWLITANNVTKGSAFAKFIREYPCTYGIMCYEKGKKEQRDHVHAYYQFASPKSFSTIRKAFLKMTAHIDHPRGTLAQIQAYIKKDGDFVEWGAATQQGRRNDIHEVTAMLDSGASMGDVARAAPELFVKMYRGFQEYALRTNNHPRTFRSAVIWRWGKYGTGKSWFVKNKHAGNLYIKEPAHKWWNGYAGQEAVLIDDFDATDGFWRTKEGLRTLLRLIDEGPCQVEFKGGMMEFNSRFIYITSEHHPSTYWSGNELDQVLSRIASVTECVEDHRKDRTSSAAEALRVAEELYARTRMVESMSHASSSSSSSSSTDDALPTATTGAGGLPDASDAQQQDPPILLDDSADSDFLDELFGDSDEDLTECPTPSAISHALDEREAPSRNPLIPGTDMEYRCEAGSGACRLPCCRPRRPVIMGRTASVPHPDVCEWMGVTYENAKAQAAAFQHQLQMDAEIAHYGRPLDDEERAGMLSAQYDPPVLPTQVPRTPQPVQYGAGAGGQGAYDLPACLRDLPPNPDAPPPAKVRRGVVSFASDTPRRIVTSDGVPPPMAFRRRVVPTLLETPVPSILADVRANVTPFRAVAQAAPGRSASAARDLMDARMGTIPPNSPNDTA